ncbi:MAG: spermidine synthase, partial [Sciscionella sp.]|nr:spermidine synthase [Sciscionella sp.]
RTAHGITLFCDDDRQSSELSQLVYHEALLVPALLLAKRIDRVLIIGSSEGVASQLAIAAGAGHVDHVDIDAEAVRLCARLLPYGYTESELTDAIDGHDGGGRIRVRFVDGWEFVRHAVEAGQHYDVVLIDLPDERPDDPRAQHNRLYRNDFLAMCAELLTPGGVLGAQAGCPTMWRDATLRAAYRRFTDVFATTVYFGCAEHEWAFLFGRADVVDDPATRMIERLPSLGYRPEFIDGPAILGSTVPPLALRTGAGVGPAANLTPH